VGWGAARNATITRRRFVFSETQPQQQQRWMDCEDRERLPLATWWRRSVLLLAALAPARSSSADFDICQAHTASIFQRIRPRPCCSLRGQNSVPSQERHTFQIPAASTEGEGRPALTWAISGEARTAGFELCDCEHTTRAKEISGSHKDSSPRGHRTHEWRR